MLHQVWKSKAPIDLSDPVLARFAGTPSSGRTARAEGLLVPIPLLPWLLQFSRASSGSVAIASDAVKIVPAVTNDLLQ
jgi:hypothetical protein